MAQRATPLVLCWHGSAHIRNSTFSRYSQRLVYIGNLLRVIGEPDNPDRPFVLVGKVGTIAQHGYSYPARLIGKRCLIYSGGRSDSLAIEPKTGEHWGQRDLVRVRLNRTTPDHGNFDGRNLSNPALALVYGQFAKSI